MREVRQEVYEKLTEAFMRYQSNLENPMPDPDVNNISIIDRYQNDAMFNAKVNNLTAGVMKLIEPYLRGNIS